MSRSALLPLALLLGAPQAEAQAVDVYFRSWRWLKEPSAARAAGLAGAMTAVADDASSAESNPAALTTLAKSELVASVLSRGSGRTPEGDALRPGTRAGFLGLGGRLTSRWAVGAYVVEPQAVEIESEASTPSSGTDAGRILGTLTDAGGAVAWHPASRLHLGLRLVASRLSLDGSYRLQPSGGGTALEVTTRGEATSLSASFGVLFEAGPRVLVGLARLGGSRFEVPRVARLAGPEPQVLGDQGPAEVRQPTVVSGGVSVLAGRRLLVTGQLDYVRYGEIQTPFASRPPGESARFGVYAWEPRLGVELSLPFSSSSLQLRAGLYGRRSAGTQRSAAAFPTLADAAAMPRPAPPPMPGPPPATETRSALQAVAAALPEAPPPDDGRFLRGALGASLATARGLRFDVAVRLGEEGSTVLAGTTIRF